MYRRPVRPISAIQIEFANITRPSPARVQLITSVDARAQCKSDGILAITTAQAAISNDSIPTAYFSALHLSNFWVPETIHSNLLWRLRRLARLLRNLRREFYNCRSIAPKPHQKAKDNLAQKKKKKESEIGLTQWNRIWSFFSSDSE